MAVINGNTDTLSVAVFALIAVAFTVIVVGFVSFIYKAISQWSRNNKQPILVILAKIISKRTHISSSAHNQFDASSHHHTSTDYYIGFESASGERREFLVSGQEYGLLTESDSGKLKFQGTRYLGFERSV